jgi:hypothetical protein
VSSPNATTDGAAPLFGFIGLGSELVVDPLVFAVGFVLPFGG